MSGKIENRVRYLRRLGGLYAYGNYGIEENTVKALDCWFECNRLSPSFCDREIEIYKDYPEFIVRTYPDEYAKNTNSIAPAGIQRGYEFFKEGNYKNAYEIFLWHSRNGNAEAQLELYRLHKLGLVEKNDPKAIGWLYLSAKNGNSISQNELGSLINNGVIGGSESEFLFWYNLSAKQNDPNALYNLGFFYSQTSIETKSPPDYNKSLDYFQKAAVLNLPNAFNSLGVMYLNGYGVAKNLELAKGYFIKGAVLGDLYAKSNLYLNFGVDSAQPSKPKIAKQEVKPKKASVQSAKSSKAKAKENIVEEAPAIKYKENIDPKAVEPIIGANQLFANPLNPIDLYSQTSPSVYRIIAMNSVKDGSQGSGVAITANNVITNCHVIDKMDLFGTKFEDKVIFFKLFKEIKKKDVCILSTDAKLPPVKGVRKFDSLKIGEKVYAIGSPNGLENTLTEGLISGLRSDEGVKVIQTSAAISQGSSGGGLFDSNGQLIGITTFSLKGNSLNFAISIDEVPNL